MFKTKNYIIADFGASNGRIYLGKFDKEKIALEEIHRFDNYPILINKTRYWDILKIYLELINGIKVASLKYKDIRSIGINTWGLDFGLIDKKGDLVSNPISYRDKSKINYSLRAFLDKISEQEFFHRTGWLPNTLSPAFYLANLAQKKSLIFKIANNFLMLPDLLNFFLTGIKVSEFTIANNSHLVNWQLNNWDQKILDKFSIPIKLFPEISKAGIKLGKIKNSICKNYGFRQIDLSLVASHDTASAVAGIPNVNSAETWAFMAIGTWNIIGIEVPKPILHQDSLKYGFTNEGGATGNYFYAKNFTGLWVIQQCMQKWKSNEKISWSDIDLLFPIAKPFQFFMDLENPFFSLQHNDMTKIIIDYCKNKGEIIPQSIGEISRGFYESMVMLTKYYFDILKKIYKKDIKIIYLFGGGVKNKLLCQWISDCLGVLVIMGSSELTSVGNFLMQLKADGEIKQLNEGRSIVLKSLPLNYFEPLEPKKWENNYYNFLKFIKK